MMDFDQTTPRVLKTPDRSRRTRPLDERDSPAQPAQQHGDALVFDSHLWHRGGDNHTQAKRRAINQQFTRSFIKQQIDYPTLLKGKVDRETPLARTLGMWTVPPKSVQEFRVKDPSQRTYRGGQS